MYIRFPSSIGQTSTRARGAGQEQILHLNAHIRVGATSRVATNAFQGRLPWVNRGWKFNSLIFRPGTVTGKVGISSASSWTASITRWPACASTATNVARPFGISYLKRSFYQHTKVQLQRLVAMVRPGPSVAPPPITKSATATVIPGVASQGQPCRLAFNRGLPHFVWWWSLRWAKRSTPYRRRRISVK